MRCLIRVSESVWCDLRSQLLASSLERMAYLLARASRWEDPWRGPALDLLVRRAIPIPDSALSLQSSVRVEVSPGFTQAVLRACYEGGLSLVDIHTHPFSGSDVGFSGHDWDNMAVTHNQFLDEMPAQPPAVAASLVIGQSSVAGAWTSPAGRRLAPIDNFQLIGPALKEERLCAR